MPIFVHLAPANRVRNIRHAGIKYRPRGVFCLPVVPVYYVSHQWARELRRRGQGVIVAIDFRLPDDEQVWVGRYFEQHRLCTASAAAKEIMDAADPAGYEVIVPRSIAPSELRKVRAVSQVSGWRYRPRQHERAGCLCPYCSRGEIGIQRMRRYAERLAKMRGAH